MRQIADVVTEYRLLGQHPYRHELGSLHGQIRELRAAWLRRFLDTLKARAIEEGTASSQR
jgi:hypothetical protein